MSKSILPYERHGAWTVSHPFYYDCAYRTLNEFQATLLRLQAKEQELRVQYSDEEEPLLTAFIYKETCDLHREAFKIATSSFLFLCMCIESFINHYGTKRLGEEYYKRNLERVGITEKLSLLVVICHQTKLDPNDPMLKKTRALFDKRNELVHPKTKEFNFEKPEDFFSKHPKEINLQSDFDDMEYIVQRLCELDSDIDRSGEFMKPAEG